MPPKRNQPSGFLDNRTKKVKRIKGVNCILGCLLQEIFDSRTIGQVGEVRETHKNDFIDKAKNFKEVGLL